MQGRGIRKERRALGPGWKFSIHETDSFFNMIVKDDLDSDCSYAVAIGTQFSKM